jgi:hypothetical protein
VKNLSNKNQVKMSAPPPPPAPPTHTHQRVLRMSAREGLHLAEEKKLSSQEWSCTGSKVGKPSTVRKGRPGSKEGQGAKGLGDGLETFTEPLVWGLGNGAIWASDSHICDWEAGQMVLLLKTIGPAGKQKYLKPQGLSSRQNSPHPKPKLCS